ncbi:MAG: acyl-CoA dehydrogenase family protein, partial [Bdellovibrionaceae bacterium]|nr:acyl-CoA dehydrogenase family protein [Pseudobdellovibrionaceae bacterium]
MELLETYHGILAGDALVWSLPLSLLLLLLLGFWGSPLLVWSLAILLLLWGFAAPLGVIVVVATLLLLFNLTPLRATLVSRAVMALFKKFQFIPKISETERTALDAGVTWIEKDLFSGRPDFNKIMSEPYPHLTAEEKAFLDGPCEELCKKIDQWKIWRSREIPQEVWDFIKKEKFLGMIIPKEYGGLGFSALAHSEV